MIIASFFSFLVGISFFKNIYSGIILTIFTSLGLPILWVYNTEFLWTSGFLLIFPLSWLFFQLFSNKLNLFKTGLTAFICGITLNTTTLELTSFIILTSFLIAYSQTYHLNFKKKYTFLWLHLSIFSLFFIGFAGSQGLELFTQNFARISSNTWTLDKLIKFTTIHFFPGYIFLILATIGLVTSLFLASNLLIFFTIIIIISLGLFPNYLEYLNIKTKDLIFILYYFLAIYAAWGIKLINIRYHRIFSFLITFLLIFESIYWLQNYNFEHYKTPTTQISQTDQLFLNKVKSYLNRNNQNLIIDDQNLFSINQWKRAGIEIADKQQKEAVFKNINLADFYGISLIFTDRFTNPNPEHFRAHKLNNHIAWINKQAYSNIKTFPASSLRYSTNSKINYLFKNNKIKFNEEAYLTKDNENIYFQSNQKTNKTEFTTKTIRHTQNNWQIIANFPSPGLIIFTKKLTDSKFFINNQQVTPVLVNNYYLGIPLDKGRFELEIKQQNNLQIIGTNLFLKTSFIFLILFLAENIWKYYRKNFLS